MTKRAARIAITVLVVLVAHVGLRVWFDAASETRSIVYATAAQLRDNKDEINILLLGDSHVKCGIDAEAIPGAFNLATLGGQYHHMYHDLRWALDVGVRPNLVVMPLDTHSLAWQPLRMEEPEYWARRLSYPALAWEFGYAAYVRRWFDGAWFPYWGEGEFMARWALGRSIQQLSYPVRKGSVTLDVQWTEKDAETRQREGAQRVAFLHADYAIFNEVEMNYFRACIDLCREHDIEVILVRTPMSEVARDAVADQGAFESMEAMAARAEIDLDSVQFADFADVFGDRVDVFADADHLNADGAKEFTSLLAIRLEASDAD